MDQNDVEYWIKKLLSYYNVSTYTQLADKLNTTQQNITNWKTRNSVLAVEKKCRELGIYQDIFGDVNTNSISQGNNSRASNGDYIENAQKGYHDSEFDDLTISLIKKCITKYNGEENFQFKLMDLLKNG